MEEIYNITIKRMYTNRLYLKIKKRYCNTFNYTNFYIDAYLKGSKESIAVIEISGNRGYYGNNSNIGFHIVDGKNNLNKGYMSEIIARLIPILKEYNIQACCYKDNTPSDRILSKVFPFKREDLHVNCYSFDNWER